MSLYGLGISGFGGCLGGSRFLIFEKTAANEARCECLDQARGFLLTVPAASRRAGDLCLDLEDLAFLAVANGGRWRAAVKISENIEKR